MDSNAAERGMEDLKSKVESAKQEISDFAEKSMESARGAYNRAKEWGSEHPMATIGIVAGVSAAIGFALGMLLSRRD